MVELYQQILWQNQQMAKQNTNLIQMIERFGFQESGSIRLSSNPEFILESLASNIKEFVYYPENGFVFDRWYRSMISFSRTEQIWTMRLKVGCCYTASAINDQ